MCRELPYKTNTKNDKISVSFGTTQNLQLRNFLHIGTKVVSVKAINILSLVQAYKNLDEEIFIEFLSHYNIEIKNEEIEDLKKLVEILKTKSNNRIIKYEFYVGYKIPQIGKEFDLLFFGSDHIINIELKSSQTEEKIKKQLIRNKYYLSHLKENKYYFTFISDEKKLYALNEKNELESKDFSSLNELIVSQKNNRIKEIDDLFNPSDYLVSPFNSTKKFIKNDYFLTQQQESIKNEVLEVTKNRNFSFVSITGSAGTGKTLLTYDIAKHLKNKGENPLIIHCGNLNAGQEKLKSYGWEIIPIKTIHDCELSNCSVIFIDEVQRIYTNQLQMIIGEVKSRNITCIFSYDKTQTLATWEKCSGVDKIINGMQSITKYKLSEKIRTNKEIAGFIKALFNNKRNNLNVKSKGEVEFNYFNNIYDARRYLILLSTNRWRVLEFTPSQYKNEYHKKYSCFFGETSHSIIGQEFDNVAIIIDELFSYNKDGDLFYRGRTYYDAVKMLFQNITRTRKKLKIVIINNGEILNRCLKILST